VDGGTGSGWTDTIELEGFAGQPPETGWTLVLDNGATASLDANGDYVLGEDASGTIVFDDGGTITFDGIEKISW